MKMYSIHISTLITCVFLLMACSPFKKTTCTKPAPYQGLNGTYAASTKSQGSILLAWKDDKDANVNTEKLELLTVSKKQIALVLGNSDTLFLRGKFHKKQFVYRSVAIRNHYLLFFSWKKNRYTLSLDYKTNLTLSKYSSGLVSLFLFPLGGADQQSLYHYKRIH